MRRLTSTPIQRIERTAKLVPLGANDGFDPLPEVVIGDDDLSRAAEVWDATMPKKYRGLLDAEVVRGD